MIPFLLLFQTTPAFEMSPATISILSFGVAAATNYVVSRNSAARIEGANAEKFKAIEQRLAAADSDNRQQWISIGSHTKSIGEIRGELNAKAKGHHG